MAQWTGVEFQELRFVIKIGEEHVRWAEFSSDGRLLAVGSPGGSLPVWNLQTGVLLRELNVATGAVLPRAFLPRENSVLVAHADNSVHEWDLTTWQEKRSWQTFDAFRSERVLARESGTVHSNFTIELAPALSPDGKRLAVTGIGQARVLDTITKRELVRLSGFMPNTTRSPFRPMPRDWRWHRAGKRR